MEKLKVTHDHSLTDILKVLIFAIILLMPFLVYAPTALYYGFNEHAHGTETVTEGGWEVQNKYQTNEVNNNNDLILGNIYHLDDFAFSGQDFEEGNINIEIIVLNCKINTLSSNNSTIDEMVYDEYNANNNNYLHLYADEYGMTLYYTNGDLYQGIYYEGYYIEFEYLDFIIDSYLNSFKSYLNENNITPSKSDFNVYSYEYTEEVEVQKNITQMMEKNWDDLWETNLFKWTNESILKNGLDNFTQAFGITNTSHINNLITYELIMVGVYIVIDIVLALFKWLTHMIGNK